MVSAADDQGYRPGLILSYVEGVPESWVEQFRRELAAANLNFTEHKRSAGQLYAGLEWFVPTLIFAWIGKAYFEAFLKELGKDHYNALKSSLQKLLGKANSIKPVVTGSPGKVSSERKYSFSFSIIVELRDGTSAKFLIEEQVSEIHSAEAIDALFSSLSAYYLDEADSFSTLVDTSQLPAGMKLLAYDAEAKKIVRLNPFVPQAGMDNGAQP